VHCVPNGSRSTLIAVENEQLERESENPCQRFAQATTLTAARQCEA